jgi:hypothetical protein
MHEVSAEGLPVLGSEPDGEPLPSVWEEDATHERETDPDAVTSPGRRLRPPPRRSSLGPRGLRPARPRRRAAEPGTTRRDDVTSTNTRASGLSTTSDDEPTGSFTVQLPSGLGAAELEELGGERRCDVRQLSARRLEALSPAARRQLFVRLAGQQAVVGTELALDDSGRHRRRDATTCGLVLLASRHVSRHRSRPLVAEMFAVAPEALLVRVAQDRRLSRAVVDHLPAVLALTSSSGEAPVRQAAAAWLRQRSATATQAVARVVRQAPVWDRHAAALSPHAARRTATVVVAALDVLIAQQTFAAGEIAVAVARLIDGPGVGDDHASAIATCLCERAASGFVPDR